MAGIAVVVGVGPGLGLAIATEFAKHGMPVAILARNHEKIAKFAEEIVKKEASAQVSAISVDCSDASSIKTAFEAVNSLGNVEVLVYNVNSRFPWPPPKFMDINPDSFVQGLNLSCVGAFHCVQQVIRGMLENKRGTILFTGATGSVRGSAGFSEFACGKFALRALGQSLAREFGPQGIHVAHVIVDGIIGKTAVANAAEGDKVMSPEAMAEVYWQLHAQDKSVWTHELDIRPYCEKF